jgi:uncharacterized damage-inducible protein DinB
VNEALLEAVRHNTWGTRTLLDVARSLPEDQLTSTAPGTYGTILDTFNHIVGSETSYLSRLSGDAPDWKPKAGERVGLEQLAAWNEELADRWERFLAEDFDPERIFIMDEGAYQAKASVLLVQALHHGNAHREQISATLTAIGTEPPDIQAWGWADATGRGGPRTPDE